MTNIKFFTPVKYGNHAISFREKLLENTDFYFYLGSRSVAEIIPGNVQKGSQAVILRDEPSNCWKTALKVASYFTIILPALMLLTKMVLRTKYHFHTYPHRKPWGLISPKKAFLQKKNPNSKRYSIGDSYIFETVGKKF